MRGKWKLIVAVVVGAMLAAGLTACGGSSGSATAEGSKTTGGSESSSTSEAGSSEPSREFITKGGENKIPTFGQEAEAAEREAASAVLEENLQARAVGDWASQCSSLTEGAIKEVKESSPAAGAKTCAKALEAFAEPLAGTKSVRANTMTGPIAVLRVEGNKAYALYHGTGGKNYAMPMEKVGDEWKVAALITETP
jgi:hypothetical protein